MLEGKLVGGGRVGVMQAGAAGEGVGGWWEGVGPGTGDEKNFPSENLAWMMNGV